MVNKIAMVELNYDPEIHPFELAEIKGGFHPLITVIINGIEVVALIDTGANISCHNMFGETVVTTYLRIGNMVFQGKMPYYKIAGDYKLIIGSDILRKTNAIIDYRLRKITFHRV